MGPVERACHDDQRVDRSVLWFLPKRAMAPKAEQGTGDQLSVFVKLR